MTNSAKHSWALPASPSRSPLASHRRIYKDALVIAHCTPAGDGGARVISHRSLARDNGTPTAADLAMANVDPSGISVPRLIHFTHFTFSMQVERRACHGCVRLVRRRSLRALRQWRIAGSSPFSY
jgi:hypothetical protein